MANKFNLIALEDRLKVNERVARYSWAIDSGDMDAYLDCFMEDGYVEHPLPDGTPHRFAGHEGIRGWLGNGFADRANQTYGHQHQFNAIVLSPAGEDVRLQAYCTIFRHEFHRKYWPSGPSWRMGAWYALLGRADDDWKLKAVEVRMWTDTALGAGTALVNRPPGSPGIRN